VAADVEGDSAGHGGVPRRRARCSTAQTCVPSGSVARGLTKVILLEDLVAELDASFANEKPRTGDEPRKLGRFWRLWPDRPTDLVAERASRWIGELATRWQVEEFWMSHISQCCRSLGPPPVNMETGQALAQDWNPRGRRGAGTQAPPRVSARGGSGFEKGLGPAACLAAGPVWSSSDELCSSPPGEFDCDQPSSTATETIGRAGGFPPREPKNGLSEKLKMPPSSATIR
jgi:hypothetical protein